MIKEDILNDLGKKPAPPKQKPKRQFEKIIGVTNEPGELTFGIKFKGIEIVEFVPARIANLRYPKEIIEYYEERLVWETGYPRRFEKVKLHGKSCD